MQNEQLQTQKEIVYKRVTMAQLTAEYGVARSTMLRQIKLIPDLGERLGHWWNSVQSKKIHEHLGVPVVVWYYYPAFIVAGMFMMLYNMIFNVESLIRRFFCYRPFDASGPKSRTADVLNITFRIVQVVATFLIFWIVEYYIGLEIFKQDIHSCPP